MTDNNHPITPLPELVQQWREVWEQSGNEVSASLSDYVATQAARWGADVQLEACEKYWMTHGISPEGVVRMREHLRPKPPSLKEQALQELERVVTLLMPVTGPNKVERFAIIRRALEQLDD